MIVLSLLKVILSTMILHLCTDSFYGASLSPMLSQFAKSSSHTRDRGHSAPIVGNGFELVRFDDKNPEKRTNVILVVLLGQEIKQSWTDPLTQHTSVLKQRLDEHEQSQTQLTPDQIAQMRDEIAQMQDIIRSIRTPSSNGHHRSHCIMFMPNARTIEASAFAGNINICEVHLPQGLQSIGNGAFTRTRLSEVTITSSVTSIGEPGVFSSRVMGASLL
jgi:hypothetical protein